MYDVCVCMHACACHTCRGQRDNLRSLSLHPTLLEAGPLCCLCCGAYAGLAGQQVSEGFSCLCLSSHCSKSGIIDMHYCAKLDMGTGDLNTWLHACVTLPAEPTLQFDGIFSHG